MPLHIEWPTIALRLALTLLAGAVIGLNRGEHGRAAGLRTTLLVCLAASISMIQVNLLLDLSGKTPASFAVMDMMRLPLGILTGVGFIGAGSILKKGDLVKGITTAATLWYVTVLGLCLGGGQLLLGILGTALGVVVLWGIKPLENRLNQKQHGRLTLVCSESGPHCAEVSRALAENGACLSRWLHFQQNPAAGQREQTCEVSWKAAPHDVRLPSFVQYFSEQPGVLQVRWNR